MGEQHLAVQVELLQRRVDVLHHLGQEGVGAAELVEGGAECLLLLLVQGGPAADCRVKVRVHLALAVRGIAEQRGHRGVHLGLGQHLRGPQVVAHVVEHVRIGRCGQ